MKRAVVSLAAGIALIGAMELRAATYSQAILNDGPIGYWRLGEATGPTAFDASPNGLDGSYVGGVTYAQPGAVLADADTSVLFDGTSGHVNVGAQPSLNQLTNDFTMEAWVNVPPAGGPGGNSGGSIFNTRSFSPEAGYKFNTSSSFGVVFTTFGRQDYIFAPTIPINTWTHLAVVFDSSNDAHLYINGDFMETITGTLPVKTNSQSFNIGRQPTNVFGDFNGGLDEVAIYGRSLLADEIRGHYLVAIGVPEPSTLVICSLLAFLAIPLARWQRRRAA